MTRFTVTMVTTLLMAGKGPMSLMAVRAMTFLT